MDCRLHQRDPETIERDVRALRIVSDGLARIRFLADHRTTDADVEIWRLASFLEEAPRLTADHISDPSLSRWHYLIDDRTARAAQIMAERGPFDEPDRTTKRPPFGWRSLARIVKTPLLLGAGVVAGYLASPAINTHDDFTGIEATYPSTTVTCTPPQMVASIPNPDVRGGVPVMFPCPDERRSEIPARSSLPQKENQ